MSRRKKGGPKAPAANAATLATWCAWLTRAEGDDDGPPPQAFDAAPAARAFLRGDGEPPVVTGVLAEAVVRCLAEAHNAEGLKRCVDTGGKALGKAARRALHGLRRKGVDAPAPRPSRGSPPSGLPGPLADEDRRATLTTPFGDGDRILIFRFRGDADRRLHAGVATLSDQRGVRELELYLGNARLYQSMARQAGERVPAATVPFDHAYHRLGQAVGQSRTQGRLVPEAWSACRSLLSAPLDAAPHPARELAAGEVPGPDDWLALWRRGEIRSWTPPGDVLEALGARLQEVLGSTLIVNEDQRRAQLGATVDQQVIALLSGPGRDRWVVRLEDAAWVAAEQRAPEVAGQLLALRDQLVDSESPELLPFWRQLLVRPFLPRLPPDLAAFLAPGLAAEAPDAPGEQADEGSLLWTPDQGPDPTTRGGGGQGPASSGGGLIVPGR